MVTVNSTTLYEYLKEQTKLVKALDNKEIVLSIFAAQHLQGHYDFHSGTGTAATGVGLIMSMFSLNPVFTALTIVTGSLGAVAMVYNIHKSKKLTKYIDIFAEEVTTRYPDVITAYVEISALIQSIEREEILKFFEKAGAIK